MYKKSIDVIENPHFYLSRFEYLHYELHVQVEKIPHILMKYEGKMLDYFFVKI